MGESVLVELPLRLFLGGGQSRAGRAITGRRLQEPGPQFHNSIAPAVVFRRDEVVPDMVLPRDVRAVRKRLALETTDSPPSDVQAVGVLSVLTGEPA